MLSLQERMLVSYLATRQREPGGSTFREMAPYAGTKSTSAISRMLDSLEERGYLRRMRKRASAVEVLREPEDGRLPIIPPSQGVTIDVPMLKDVTEDVRVWVAGEDGPNTEKAWVPVDASCRKLIGWRMNDSSMNGLGIFEGDLCVLIDSRSKTWAHRTTEGSIVLAKIADSPLMLRRIAYEEGGSCILTGGSGDADLIRTNRRVMRIEGMMISSLRTYA